MGEQKKYSLKPPRYQQIAIEVATRIVSREYRVGQTIYARSTLASQHGVSAETARRAICVLSDLDIVTSTKGSGVKIVSYENAERFIEQQSQRQSINTIKKDILESVERQRKEMENLSDSLSDFLDATENFRSLNPFVPFQVRITEDCKYLNKNISELAFWQNTGATIVAVERNNSTILSPGPYLQLTENDTLYFITQDTTPDSVNYYLYPNEE